MLIKSCCDFPCILAGVALLHAGAAYTCRQIQDILAGVKVPEYLLLILIHVICQVNMAVIKT